MQLQDWPIYWINGIAAALTLIVLGLIAVSRRDVRRPGRLQGFFEWSIAELSNLFRGALGPNGERHLPLVLTLFFYILFANLAGLIPTIPGYKPDGTLAEPYVISPTAATSTTIALALIVFVYVQYIGIRARGFLGYLKHFIGPVPALFLLFIPIEIIGEVVKPFSLSMRLFGNIYGEDVINGLALGAGGHYFIPVQFFINILQTFTDVVQAFIFALLTCAYISIMSDTHEEEHGGDLGAAQQMSDPSLSAQIAGVPQAKIGIVHVHR